MARVVRKAGPGRAKLDFALKNLDGKVGRVGWFESAQYPDGMPVAYAAAIAEHGYPNGGIPARPHGRPTIAENQGKWRETAAQGSKAVLAGESTIGNVMEAIGMQAAGDWAKTISKIQTPPLKPATIKARQSKRANKKSVGNLTKPLVDSGLMISTVSNDVIAG